MVACCSWFFVFERIQPVAYRLSDSEPNPLKNRTIAFAAALYTVLVFSAFILILLAIMSGSSRAGDSPLSGLLLTLIVGSVALAGAGAYWLGQRFVDRPLAQLTETTNYLALGERADEHQMLQTHGGLFGELADSIVGMSAQVHDMIDQLELSETRLDSVLMSLDDAVYSIAWPQVRVLYVSPAFAAIYGQSVSGFVNRPASMVDAVHPDDRARVLALAETLGRVEYIEDEHRIVRADGEERWVLQRVYLVCDAAGNGIRLDGIVTDVTRRHEREHEIRRRTQQLEVANQELASFNYSVSHDLRTPLRAIDGFSLAIFEDYHDQLDETGRDYLQRIRHASQRMGRLIEDLLTLSQIVQQSLELESVNLSLLAAEIEQELRAEFPEHPVNFTIEPELIVTGDQRLLRAGLARLLHNGWKFTTTNAARHAVGANVTLGKTVQGNETIYYVQDNGCGYDMAYAEKLFIPFQRLHPSDEYPGTGIGLAVAKRVMLRHGGRIWATSELAQGTTVYFVV